MVWGAIIGAGISAFGQSQQKKANEAANAATFAQQAEGQQILEEGAESALAAQRKGIEFADEGFKKALGVSGIFGEASRSRTLSREKELKGAASASAINRGLFNTTQALNQQRGVSEATSQTLAGIDESVAGLMANIHQNRGRTLLQGQSQLAGLHQQLSSAQAGLATSLRHQAADVAGGYGQAAMGIGQLLMQYEWMNKLGSKGITFDQSAAPQDQPGMFTGVF